MTREDAEALVARLAALVSDRDVETLLAVHTGAIGPFFYDILAARTSPEFVKGVAKIHARLTGSDQERLLDLMPRLLAVSPSAPLDGLIDDLGHQLNERVVEALLNFAEGVIAWQDEPGLARQPLAVACQLIERLGLDFLRPALALQTGNLHLRLGELREADEAFRAGLEASRSWPDPLVGGALAVSLGLLLIERRRFADAIAHYETELPRIGDTTQRHAARNNLARAHFAMGRTSLALEHWLDLEVACRAAGHTNLLADVHGNLAIVYERLGLLPEQERHLLEGHKLRLRPIGTDEPLNWTGVATSCVNLHLYYMNRSRFDRAHRWLDEALRLLASGGLDPRGDMAVRLQIGLALAEGDNDAAWRLAMPALDSLAGRPDDDMDDEAVLLAANVGRAALVAGQGRLARPIFERLIRLCEAAGSLDLLVSSLGYLARTLIAGGAVEQAFALLDRMVAAEVELREELHDPLHQYSFSGVLECLHDGLIDDLLKLANMRRLFEMIQLAKAFAIGIGGQSRATFSALTVALPVGTAFLEYDHHGGRSFCLVAAAGALAPELVTLEISASQVEALALEFQRRIGWACHSMSDEPFDCLREAAAGLLAPVLKRMGPAIRHLIIAPAGTATRLPFHAFPLGTGGRLIERYAVSYAPNASIWLAATGRARPPISAAVVAYARAADSADVRAQFHEEATRVAAAIQAAGCMLRSLSCDSDDALAVLLQNVDADIMHVAAHGVFIAENPASSGIELSVRGQSIMLSLDVLAGMNVSTGLAFLSGCDTGRVAALANQEVLGLMSILLGQHVSSAILSFWPVPAASETVVSIVGAFYRRWLGDGLPKAEALRQAMLPHRGTRLYEWAGFALFGACA